MTTPHTDEQQLEPCPFCGSAAEPTNLFNQNERLIGCSVRKCVLFYAKIRLSEWNTRARLSTDGVAPTVRCTCLANGNQVAWEYVHHTNDCPTYKAGEAAKQWLLNHPRLKGSRIFEGAAGWDREKVATLLVQFAAATAAPQPQSRHMAGSSRHPHFTAEDHQRMKETLDALSDNPTEEEAEAVLRACGTSGKEVVNEFIERLLKENLELKNQLAPAAPVEQSESYLTSPPSTPLLQKIIEITDMGSAQEFGDADERLRAIRGLITGKAV